jgi:hypothetical protein
VVLAAGNSASILFCVPVTARTALTNNKQGKPNQCISSLSNHGILGNPCPRYWQGQMARNPHPHPHAFASELRSAVRQRVGAITTPVASASGTAQARTDHAVFDGQTEQPTKFCDGCREAHHVSRFLRTRFTSDGLTDRCLTAIKQAADIGRLARERRMADSQGLRRSRAKAAEQRPRSRAPALRQSSKASSQPRRAQAKSRAALHRRSTDN